MSGPEYRDVWREIPVNDEVVDIPEGATEEGAAQGRVLPDDLSPEQVEEILRDPTR